MGVSIPHVMLLASLWLVWACAARWIAGNPKGDIPGGIAWLFLHPFTRLYHGLSVEGKERLPTRQEIAASGRPLIVVANHTAGVDPLLMQDVCGHRGGPRGFFIRWVMASHMRLPHYDFVWEWVGVIFVTTSPVPGRSGGELLSVKEMIRHLRSGGVLGIFPEGGISEARGVLVPFKPGLGVLVAKTGARVLPLIIEGTAEGRTAWHSLLTPGRARVRVMPVLDYEGKPAAEIVADLQRRYQEWTGWRLGD